MVSLSYCIWTRLSNLIRSLVFTTLRGYGQKRCSFSSSARPRPKPRSALISNHRIEQADLVLQNAHIVTMTVNQCAPEAEAIAVLGDRILAVGTDDEVGRHIGSDTEVIDVGGKTVVPGMIDSHAHFVDIVVLSKDIMTIPAEEILTTEVLMTFLGGKMVYEKPTSKND